MILFGINIPDIMLILSLEGVIGVLFIASFVIYNRNRFTALLCEKYLNTFKIKKKMKPSLFATEFTWKSFTYQVDMTKAIVDNRNKPIIYYNYIYAKPITVLTGQTNVEDAQVFKIVNDGKIMTHLGDRKMTRTYMFIILGLIVVVGVVSVASIYFMQQNGKDISILARDMANITKSLINSNNRVIIP